MKYSGSFFIKKELNKTAQTQELSWLGKGQIIITIIRILMVLYRKSPLSKNPAKREKRSNSPNRSGKINIRTGKLNITNKIKSEPQQISIKAPLTKPHKQAI